MENTMTKAQMYEFIAETCADNEVIVDFCEKNLAALAKQAERSKARAAAKRAASEPLTSEVYSVLTEEPATCEAIYAAVAEITEVEEISKSKVIARLSKLCKQGEAIRSEVVVNGKKKAAYTKA